MFYGQSEDQRKYFALKVCKKKQGVKQKKRGRKKRKRKNFQLVPGLRSSKRKRARFAVYGDKNPIQKTKKRKENFFGKKQNKKKTVNEQISPFIETKIKQKRGSIISRMQEKKNI